MTHNEDKMFPVRVHILRVSTGEARVIDDELPAAHDWSADFPGPSFFRYKDGNEACDCSRAMLFARANREPDPNAQCTEGQYLVNMYNRETGKRIYREFESPYQNDAGEPITNVLNLAR
jgi:hypothetical protein